jgi:hypothetical protein
MTLDEEDDFIQKIMANCDAAVAAAAESTTYTATSEGTLVERSTGRRRMSRCLAAHYNVPPAELKISVTE